MMVPDSHNNETASNSPSKIRGGAVQTAGALKVPESNSSAGVAHGGIDAPALTGTPSCPRGGVSRDAQRVMNVSKMKPFRRELRSHGTPAEGALWNMLKGKQIAGLQFRRQYSVGNYILDFYCPALRLAIELDGDYHYHMEQPDRDWKRDKVLLEQFGIKTLRFENIIVFRHPESIRFAILQEVEAYESISGSTDRVSSGGIDAPALTGTPSCPRGGVVGAPFNDTE